MARFSYKAVAASGDTVEDEMDAPTRKAVVEHLHTLGYVPIRVEENQAAGPLFGALTLTSSQGLRAGDLTLVTRSLATLLDAGLPLDQALSALQHFTRDDRGRDFIEEVRDRVRGGSALSAAFAEHAEVPGYFVGLVHAGEVGGNLAEVLRQLAESLERNDEVRATVRSALRYPAIVLGFALFAFIVLMTLVIPQFRPIFESAGWELLPLSTRIVVGISDLMINHGYVLLAALGMTGAGSYWYLGGQEGRAMLNAFVVRLPRIGKVLEAVDVARFTRTLGSLLVNGVAAVEALTMSRETVNNIASRAALSKSVADLRRGQPMATALEDTGVFPDLACQLLHVGEHSGRLDTMLLHVADIYDQESRRGLDDMLALLVPMVTAGLGIFVALIIGSIFSAIMQSYELPL